VGDGSYRRVFSTRFGRLTLGVDGDAYLRDSDENVVGRDVTRIGTGIGWSAGTVLPLGISLDVKAEVRADRYTIRKDTSYEPHPAQIVPAASVSLLWPFAKSGGGVYSTIVPIAQLAWADVSGDAVPNDDSRVVDFDEGNLFALDRFPGEDRSETGTRVNLGVAYTRIGQEWELNGYAGRIYRFDDLFQFDDATGLNGEWSDWLVSGQIGLGDVLRVTNRAVFDDTFDVARNELRLALEAGSAEFATSYLWIVAEPQVNRDSNVHEAIFTAGYEFNRHWVGALETRWDIEDERLSRTDLDLTYRNECIAVDLYVSRRLDSASSIEPSYDFGLELSLQGFGSDDSSRYARQCPG
jgi:LPS-assembly protein